MTEHVIEDFHGDEVFRDEQGRIWVPMDSKVEGMARAWDEGFDAGEADVFMHEAAPEGYDGGCIENPYRTGEK